MRIINMPPWCAVLLYFIVDIPLVILAIVIGSIELICIDGAILLINTILLIAYFRNRKKYNKASKDLNKEIARYRLPNNRSYVTNSKNGVLETYEEIILSDLYDITLVELAYFCDPFCHDIAYRNSKSYKITYDKLSKKSKRHYRLKRWANSPYSKYLIFEILFLITRINKQRRIKKNIDNMVVNYHFDSYFIKYRKAILQQQVKPE